MKKLLSVILAVFMMCFPLTSYCYAKTSWNTYNKPVPFKPISVLRQKDGEKVILQGEDSPTIVINNNNKSESKATAKASGGSLMSTLIPLAIKIILGIVATKFVLGKLTTLAGNISCKTSQIVENLKDFFSNISTPVGKDDIEEDLRNIDDHGYFDGLKNKLSKLGVVLSDVVNGVATISFLKNLFFSNTENSFN